MGWTSGDGPREAVINRQKRFETVNGLTVVAVKTHRHGNEDWFLYEVQNPDGTVLEKFIGVTTWEGRFHKEMEELVGPHYYGCPAAWLDEVPQPPTDWAAKWRAQIRANAIAEVA